MSQVTGGGQDWTLAQALRTVPHILQHDLEAPWRAVPEPLREIILRLTPIDGRFHTGESTHIARCALPWYPDAALARLVDPNWGNLAIYYIVQNDDLFRLNGTSFPIHEVNRIGPITLTPDNVLEYLKFFCFFVRGDEGPFYLLEDTDHPILDFVLDEPTQSLFDDLAQPVACNGPDENGAFTCTGTVFYGPALFQATFAVSPNGTVEMLDDAPAAVHLPVRIDARIGD